MKIVSFNAKLNPFITPFSEYNARFMECLEFIESQIDSDVICLQGIHSVRLNLGIDSINMLSECIHSRNINGRPNKQSAIEIYDERIYMKYVYSDYPVGEVFDSKNDIINAYTSPFHYNYYQKTRSTDSGLLILSKLPLSCSDVKLNNEFNGCIIASIYCRSQQKPIHIMNISYCNVYTYMSDNDYITLSIVKCMDKIFEDEHVNVICGLWDTIHHKYVKQCATILNYRFTNPAPLNNTNYILWKNVKCFEYHKIKSGIKIKI